MRGSRRTIWRSVERRAAWLALLPSVAILAFSACSSGTAPAALPPHPTAVEPARAYPTTPVPVTIHGEQFLRRLTQNVAGKPAELDATFRASLDGTALEQVAWVDASTLTARVPAGFGPGRHALTVEGPFGTRGTLADAFEISGDAPPSLAVTLDVHDASVVLGETTQVLVTARNDGQVSALGTLASLEVDGAAALEPASLPSFDLAGGTAQTRAWTVRPTAAGTLHLRAHLAATDAFTGLALSSPDAQATVQAVSGAALEATLALSSSQVSAGQGLTATLTVHNVGNDAAESVAMVQPTWRGDGGIAVGVAPASQWLGPGASTTFSWPLTASEAGSGQVSARATGWDPARGVAIDALAGPAALLIQTPPQLTSELRVSPSDVAANQSFTVQLQVANLGQAAAQSVQPSLVTFSPDGGAQALTGPTPTTARIEGGGTATFSWSYQLAAAGSYALSASASGFDANSGLPVAVPDAGTTLVVREIEPLLADPFGDQTPFAYVFAYRGHLYLGPSKSGSGAVRCAFDGSGAESVAFSFAADASGHTSSNTSPAPYPSIGATGCSANTAACGPDNENGRGLFTAGTIAGTEWLIAAGAKSGGDLNYVYMSAEDATSPLHFSYVDLSAQLDNFTQGFSAAHVFGDRLYLGFPNQSGRRPPFYALTATPSAPGLDVGDGQYIDLHGEALPGVGASGSRTLVDTISDFNGRLYVANAGGCAVSTSSTPGPANSAGNWTNCTPSGSAYTSKPSVSPTRSANLEPADKALPWLVAYKGRLYAARNTTSGPQVWSCNPADHGDTQSCDPTDWRLIATNGTGDSSLSQFNNPNNQAVTLLVASPRSLVVGFNNATDGVVLFRTTADAPAQRSDFVGLGGCNAANHPSSCAGLGGNGVGTPATLTRIFDGLAANDGTTDWIYFTAGDGSAGVRLFRLSR